MKARWVILIGAAAFAAGYLVAEARQHRYTFNNSEHDGLVRCDTITGHAAVLQYDRAYSWLDVKEP